MKLKYLRKENKLKQKQLADYLNVAESTYRSYENCTNEPSIETLKKLADFYKVSIDYLCDHPTNLYNVLEYPPFTSDLDKETINQYLKLPENKRAIIRSEIKVLGLSDKK
ncbi:MAG: helix-turn-helix domain-containing protein [Christensenellales bacterium]